MRHGVPNTTKALRAGSTTRLWYVLELEALKVPPDIVKDDVPWWRGTTAGGEPSRTGRYLRTHAWGLPPTSDPGVDSTVVLCTERVV
jgi:hypothetical protein